MNYFVIAADGQKYGPADVVTLNHWAQEGRVMPTSWLEDATTGQRVPANTVPGLMFPMNTQGASNYHQPNYQHAPGPAFGDNGASDVTKVWIFSALSVFCCSLLGIVAIIFAANAQKKGHPQAQTAMIVAIICTVIGCGGGFMALGALGNLGG